MMIGMFRCLMCGFRVKIRMPSVFVLTFVIIELGS
jgi:hypothetical protein